MHLNKLIENDLNQRATEGNQQYHGQQLDQNVVLNETNGIELVKNENLKLQNQNEILKAVSDVRVTSNSKIKY
jgi:hypothetical protein